MTSPVDLTNAPRATTFGETFIFGLTTERGDLTDCRGNALGIVGVSAPYVARAVGSTTIILDPAKPEIRPHITVISATETRARDLADAGVDLLITDSPSLATYVAKGPDAISIPLAYDRTWIVALPRPGQFAIDSAQTFRESLTRDVVPADARVAAGPIWWRDATGCAATARPVAAGGGTSRIVYSLNEPVGKALAERIVALAASGVTASGLAPNVFKAALRAGNDLAYVVPLARSGDDRCHHVDDLLSRADWLGTPGSIVPLIDTRLRAVARRNRLNLLYTRDSSITIVPRLP